MQDGFLFIYVLLNVVSFNFYCQKIIFQLYGYYLEKGFLSKCLISNKTEWKWRATKNSAMQNVQFSAKNNDFSAKAARIWYVYK